MCGRSEVGGLLIFTVGCSFAPASTANGNATRARAASTTKRLIPILLFPPTPPAAPGFPSAELLRDRERVTLRQLTLQAERERVVRPEQDVPAHTGGFLPEAPGPVEPDEHVPAALDPEPGAEPDLKRLDKRLVWHEFLQQQLVVVSELGEEEVLPVPAEWDRRYGIIEHVDPVRMCARRQNEPEPDSALCRGTSERAPEVSGGLRICGR